MLGLMADGGRLPVRIRLRRRRRGGRANLLAAASFGFPLGKKQTAKIAFIRTETLKDIGADTNSLLLAWTIAL